MTNALIDRIYEAAVIPERWTGVLDAIADLSGSAGTVLFTTDHRRITRWTASDVVAPIVQAFIAEDWSLRNPRDSVSSQRIGLAGFAGDYDILSAAELAADPMYNELLRPRGFGWFAGTHIAVPSGDVAVFDVERREASGPMPRAEIERLDLLRPHLARAAILSTRLGLERARAQAEMLDLVGLPAAILGPSGRVLAANDRLQNASGQILVRAADRITLVRPAAQALLATALARLDAGLVETPSSIPIPETEDHPAAIVHLVPVRREARDVFGQAEAVLLLTPLDRESTAPDASLLYGLFDLTPAEARVARALAEGGTLADAAVAGGVSRETVRAQLRAVLQKTGTQRQADLVRLLGSIPTFK